MTCGAGEDIVDLPALKRPRGIVSRQNSLASGAATQLNFELPCSPHLHLYGVSSHFYSVTPVKYHTGLL